MSRFASQEPLEWTYADPLMRRHDHRATATAEEVRFVRQVIEDSDAQAMLDQWEKADRTAANLRGGKKPWADATQVLTVLLVLTRSGAPQTIQAAADLLHAGLDEEAREALGLNTGSASRTGVYAQIYRSYHRMLNIIDPHGDQPRNRKMTREEFDACEAKIDPVARSVRQKRLDELCNRLVFQAFLQLPRDIRRRYRGDVAVDGTPIPAFGKHGTSKRSDWLAGEPHAAWYIRDGDHYDDPNSPAPKHKRVIWGWEATLAVMVSNDNTRQAAFPNLALGISMDKPGHGLGRNAITSLRTAAAHEDVATGHLIGDMAYGNSPKAHDYQIPAREMGYQLVGEIHKQYRGQTYNLGHAVILEGNIYCPSIMGWPKLINGTIDYKRAADDPQKIDYLTYQQRLEQRSKLLLKAHAGPRDDGTQQMRCPAMGDSPTIDCALRPAASAANTDRGGRTLLPITSTKLPAEEARGGLCDNTGGTQILKGEDYDKHAMSPAVQYGTPEWRAVYTPARQTVESFNSEIKGNNTRQNVADASRRRVRGYAATYLFISLMILATNLQRVADWMRNPVKVDSRQRAPLKKKPTSRRRDLTYGRELHRPPAASDPAPTLLKQ